MTDRKTAHAMLMRCWQFVTVAVALLATGTSHAADATTPPEAPLVVGNRTIHVFRATLGAFTPSDRADAARQRIDRAFDEGGEGWTSVKASDSGVLIELDGKPMFTVAPGDARLAAGETTADLANQASRLLQKAWRESRERRDARALWAAAGRTALAAAVLVVALLLIWRVVRVLRRAMTARLASGLKGLAVAGDSRRLSALFISSVSRTFLLLAWILSLFAVFAFLTYGLEQFVLTRPMGESLLQSFSALALQAVNSIGASLPGVFIAAIVFLVAWIATQISTEFFAHVGAGKSSFGMLDAHTAPSTRRIVNAALWLFALAMAYPYLPGAQTEAFKGLTVILGLMVSIGASGVIGQIASGVMLVYTRALSVGEYVRIQDCEGTVTELGLFVTRLRTGMGEDAPGGASFAGASRVVHPMLIEACVDFSSRAIKELFPAFKDMVAYMNTRVQSKSRVIDFQGNQFTLADLATDLAMAERAIELHEGEDADRLFAAVYAQLKRMAHRRLLDVPRAGLDTAELVHELYLRIGTDSDLKFAGQGPFFAYAARAMRGLVIDRVRERAALKRGGDLHITSLDTEHAEQCQQPEQLTDISDALDELAALQPELAQVVDLKFFCGFSMTEIAALMHTSERTAQRHWEQARLLLYRAIKSD